MSAKIAVAAGLFVGLVACVTPTSLPGDSLGKYKVVGTLGTNTCGSGIDASNPYDFTAQLSKDGTTLYLALEDGSGEVSGGFDSSDETSATLVSAVTENVNAATTGSVCNLTLATTFALKLAAGSPPATFTGSAAYAYSVATAVSSSTDCTAQLASAGGKYSTLPCTVTYSLTATRQ